MKKLATKKKSNYKFGNCTLAAIDLAHGWIGHQARKTGPESQPMNGLVCHKALLGILAKRSALKWSTQLR